jgi:hypothetical protein
VLYSGSAANGRQRFPGHSSAVRHKVSDGQLVLHDEPSAAPQHRFPSGQSAASSHVIVVGLNAD